MGLGYSTTTLRVKIISKVFAHDGNIMITVAINGEPLEYVITQYDYLHSKVSNLTAQYADITIDSYRLRDINKASPFTIKGTVTQVISEPGSNKKQIVMGGDRQLIFSGPTITNNLSLPLYIHSSVVTHGSVISVQVNDWSLEPYLEGVVI